MIVQFTFDLEKADDRKALELHNQASRFNDAIEAFREQLRHMSNEYTVPRALNYTDLEYEKDLKGEKVKPGQCFDEIDGPNSVDIVKDVFYKIMDEYHIDLEINGG